MPKKKKASKRKRKRTISLDSPSNSRENGERDDDPINHDEKQTEIGEEEKEFFTPMGIAKTPMGGLVNNIWENSLKTEDNGVPVPVAAAEEGMSMSNHDSESNVLLSGKSSSSDSSRKHESSSSSSSSDEESKSNKNRLDRKVGKLVRRISVPEPSVHPIERVESVKDEVKDVAETTPDEIPEDSHIVEAAPVENLEVELATETDSNKIQNAGCSSAETNEEIILLPETVNEKPKENVGPRNPHNKETQMVSAHPPERPTSWKCCCGLFELLTSSDR